ncbi:hypothetical protein [Stackebrandtia nassauensis]|nr:hypothetical protein [Stackebrandtia nassauensis]
MYDELTLPSDYVLYQRVSLLSDIAVMVECGHPIDCAFDGRHFYYHCTGTEPTGADRIEWYCGRHRLGYADDIDRAVWTQTFRLLPKARRARTAYQRRSLLLATHALVKVSLSDPRCPVVEWIGHKRLGDRSFHTDHDRALAHRLKDRRVEAAASRHPLRRAANSLVNPFEM